MSEMSGEQMQARIAAARRDAEGLKDRIKRKKDELADTSCESRYPSASSAPPFLYAYSTSGLTLSHDGRSLITTRSSARDSTK